MLETAAFWRRSPKILSEQLVPLPAPAALLLEPGPVAAPGPVCREAARALLDLPATSPPAPAWLAPHQIPAFRRLSAILARYGGAVLADAAGMGKSYVALAIARSRLPVTLVVPAVLMPQWRALCERLDVPARIVSTESFSQRTANLGRRAKLVVIDEAHRFRNPDTRRYRALSRSMIGSQVLLLSATPVHNRLGDLLHLFRLFLRDDALAVLGLSSLRLAALGSAPESVNLTAVAARMVVARSRSRARAGYDGSAMPLTFPRRGRHLTVTAPPVDQPVLAALVTGIQSLQGPGDSGGGPLLRLTLLRRLASSLAALRSSLERYAAYLDLAHDADRRLQPREFQRLFPRTEDGDLQLALLPLFLDSTPPATHADGERETVRTLRELCRSAEDPKAEALIDLLASRPVKSIVFTEAAATLKDLRHRLGRMRVAAVGGTAGWLGRDRAGRAEALRCFAPVAQGAPLPPAALVADVLLATDLVGEGLSLQDAGRVVHYDLPWSPARLAQRVGRIDRLGSLHKEIETAAFVPPEPLAGAIALEQRLCTKVQVQVSAGAAEVETVAGRLEREGGPFDWCDRLQQLADGPFDRVAPGSIAAVREGPRAAVLVVRLSSDLAEAIVIEGSDAKASAERATALLALAAGATPITPDRERLRIALRQAAPLVQERLAAVLDTRWRATDRDRLGRRLIPYALTTARRAARRGNRTALARLDRLVSRLSAGMSAGEEQLLEDLLRRRRSLSVADLLAWDAGLPRPTPPLDSPRPVLLAAVLLGALG